MLDGKGKWVHQCPYCKNQDITVNQIQRLEFAALADFGKGLFDVLHCHCCSADLVLPKQHLDEQFIKDKITNMKIAIHMLEKTQKIMQLRKLDNERKQRFAKQQKADK